MSSWRCRICGHAISGSVRLVEERKEIHEKQHEGDRATGPRSLRSTDRIR